MEMNIDWIIGIFVFLVFTGWALTYYFSIFQENTTRFETAAGIGQEKILDSISADVFAAPVKYYSVTTVPNGVLKAKSVWYSGEKNSTMVFSGDASLPCRIDGDDLYWQADLTAGDNYFTITTADVNTTFNCSAAFSISPFNMTVPWVFEKKTMISLTKINGMFSTSYDEFRASLGMNQNFRFTLSTSSGVTSYGKSIPSGAVDVNSKTSSWKIYETREFANITIAVW